MSPVKTTDFSNQTPIDQDYSFRSIDTPTLKVNSSFGETTDFLLHQLESVGETISDSAEVFSKHSDAVSPFADFVGVGNTIKEVDDFFVNLLGGSSQSTATTFSKGLALAKKPIGAIGSTLNMATGVVDVFKALAEDKKSGDHLQTKTAGAIVKATTKTMVSAGVAATLGVGTGLVLGSGIVATAATAGLVILTGWAAGKVIDAATDKAFSLVHDFRAGLK